MFKKLLVFVISAMIALAATTASVSAQENSGTTASNTSNVFGTLVSLETFDSVDAWEQYSSPMGVELGVENGVYRAYTMNGGYVWGLNDAAHTDIILEVEATPLTIHFGNGFGIMCRADEEGNGYYFMVNANGYYSIAKGEGDYVLPLVDWTESDAIHQEIDRNHIRAACVGDTLSMFVNGELVAEVVDSTYGVGFAGLSVAASGGTDVDVAFDNVAMYLPLTID